MNSAAGGSSPPGLIALTQRLRRNLIDRKVLGLRVVHLAIFAGLTALAFREMFSSPGVVSFQNWVWPVAERRPGTALGVFDPYLWTNYVPDPAGYTRSLINWPVFALTLFGPSPGFLERAYFVFAFAVNYAISFLAATLLIRLLRLDASQGRTEGLRILVVVLFFVNPAAIQWESGMLFSLLWGAPLLLTLSLATLVAIREQNVRFAGVGGIALALGATLDPRLAVWGAGVVLIALLFEFGYGARIRQLFLVPLIELAVALPGLALTAFAFEWSDATGAGVVGRSATIDSLTAFSTNASLPRVFELLGYWWSGLYYTDPSVLAASSAQGLPYVGNPPYVLVSTSILFSIWWVALVVFPVAAFSVLLFRRRLNVAAFLGIVALAGIAFASGTNPPFGWLAQSEVDVGHILPSGLSGVWQTVIGVPVYVQVVTESALVPMAALTVYEVASRRRSPPDDQGAAEHLTSRSWKARAWSLARADRTRGVACAAVVFLLMFGSWQFFTGSFYPAGYSPGVSAGGISPIGSTTPTTVPASDIRVYSYLESHATTGTVAWPGPVGYSYPWNPRSTGNVFEFNPPIQVEQPTGLPYLISNNLSADVAPYLGADGVQYLVVDNMSEAALEYDFALSSVAKVVDFLENCSGLELVDAYPPFTWLFSVESATGAVTSAQWLLSPQVDPSVSGPLLGVVSGLGISAAYAPSDAAGTPLEWASSAPRSGTNVSVIAPQNLTIGLGQTAVSGFGPANVSSANLTVSHPGEFGIPYSPSNWTLSVWSLPSGTIQLSVGTGGFLFLNHSGAPAAVSVNYLSSLIDGKTAAIVVDPSDVVAFEVSADAKLGSGLSAGLSFNVVSSNSSAINIGSDSSAPLNATPNWTNFSFQGELPPGARYFTLRLFANSLSGSVELRNITVRYTELAQDGRAFAGTTVSLADRNVSVPGPSGSVGPTFVVSASGTGTVSVTSDSASLNQSLDSGPSFQWLLFPHVSGSEVSVGTSGSVIIAGFAWVPADLLASAQPEISNLTSEPDYGYSGSFSFPGAAYLDLHAPYASDWRLDLYDRSTVTPILGYFGDNLFAVPAGSGSFSVSIPAIQTFPIYLLVTGGFYAVAVFAILRPRALRLPFDRVRRRLSRSHDKAQIGDGPSAERMDDSPRSK